jgi:hypothetical protein
MKPTTKKPRQTAQNAADVPVVRTIPPDAVMRLGELAAILALPMNCVRREARLGRLRVSRRGGWYFTTGRWVMAWIEAGEVKTRRKPVGLNGHHDHGG